MSYLVDSDWVADWLVGKPEATRVITTLSEVGIAISLVTFGEVYEGIYYGRDPKRQKWAFAGSYDLWMSSP
ncbi:MAG: hypothetical protein ACUVX1_10615 [Chloroflexota bacterium]